MNKQSLYMVGGAALLASTALSTTDAHAAAPIKSSAGTVATLPTTLTAAPLATQIFPTTTTAANSVTIQGTVTATSGILIDVSPTFASFDVKLDIDTTTAAFVNSVVPRVAFYQASSTGTLTTLLSSVTGCAIQPSTDRISILACNPTGASVAANGSRVDAILISGLAYTSAAALRTAGTSITLSGSTFLAGTSSTIDVITPTAVVTSKSVATDVSVQAGSAITIDNNATTPFTLLVSGGTVTTTTAVLGCVHFSAAAAVSTDLNNPFTAAVSIVSTAEVKISHSALGDSALTSITFNQQTKVASQFQGTTATFTVAGVSLTATTILATFNSTSAISASTGTPSATVTPTAAGTLQQSLAAFSGSLASLSRGGLSVELNTVLPSAMKASYISFLRIANQSSVASTAVITVKNDSTGAAVGSFTTASIPAGATLSVNSVDIDAGLTAAGATVLTNASYKVTVTGSFNGYVQNLLFNVANSSFADASGFRNGALTGDP
jgi:hypothetical protein